MKTNYTFGDWSVRYAPNLTAIVTPKGEMQISLHGTCDGLRPIQCDLQEWHANVQLMAESKNLLTTCGAVLDMLLGDGYGESSAPVLALRAAIGRATTPKE